MNVALLRPLPLRLATALLILGAAFAGAALLQYSRYVLDISSQLDLAFVVVHPWWVYAATLGLCVLGVAGAAAVLVNVPRAVGTGYMAASVLLLAAGVAAIEDARLFVPARLFGRTHLAIILLLLGLVAAALAWTFWSRPPDSANPPA